jgi:hypothetical protein
MTKGRLRGPGSRERLACRHRRRSRLPREAILQVPEGNDLDRGQIEGAYNIIASLCCGFCNSGLARGAGLHSEGTYSIVTARSVTPPLFLIVSRQTPDAGTRPLGFRHNRAAVKNGNLRRERSGLARL